jgi:hypothetical protein
MDLSKDELQSLLQATEETRDRLEVEARNATEALQGILVEAHDRFARLADRIDEAIADLDCDEAGYVEEVR